MSYLLPIHSASQVIRMQLISIQSMIFNCIDVQNINFAYDVSHPKYFFSVFRLPVIMWTCSFWVGMGRLIAVHGIRGFKAHGSVHRRQFAYRVFLIDFYKGRCCVAEHRNRVRW